MGNPLVGSVVSHRRKSGWGLAILSRDFSRSFSHCTRRWQFCSISHCPRATAVSSSCRATCTGTRGRSQCPQARPAPCFPTEPLHAPRKGTAHPSRSFKEASDPGALQPAFKELIFQNPLRAAGPPCQSQPGRRASTFHLLALASAPGAPDSLAQSHQRPDYIRAHATGARTVLI